MTLILLKQQFLYAWCITKARYCQGKWLGSTCIWYAFNVGYMF